jgi:CRISPR system Cascade subunit CasD
LARPRWHPYLGRRACPPDEPFLLGWHADPERELRERVPLPDRPHLLRREDRTVEVDLLTDTPPADEEGESTPLSELADDPYSFAPLDRRYRRRAVYRQTVALPCSLVHQLGQDYQQALFTYARAGRKKP